MLATDEDALICDLAEIYHIYNYKLYPAMLVSTLAVGLRADSRIKMKMNNERYPLTTLLQAAIVDRMSLFIWMNSKDSLTGANRPKSILAQLLGSSEEENVVGFDSPEDFESEWKKITKRGDG